jgi:hypothetical protein
VSCRVRGNVAQVKRLAALLIPAAFVLAACGGGDDTSAPTTNTVAGADSDSDSDAPADAADPAPAQPGAGSSSEYCRLFRTFDEEDPFENLDDDPGSFRDGFSQAQRVLEDIQAIAPAEIRGDFATIAEGFKQLNEALAAVDYNFFALDESALEGFEDDSFEEASERIDEYNERVCGIARDDFGDDMGNDVDLGEGFDDDSIKALIAQQLAMLGLTEAQAECLAGKLDLAALEDDDDLDPMAFFQYFEECGIDFATLGQG